MGAAPPLQPPGLLFPPPPHRQGHSARGSPSLSPSCPTACPPSPHPAALSAAPPPPACGPPPSSPESLWPPHPVRGRGRLGPEAPAPWVSASPVSGPQEAVSKGPGSCRPWKPHGWPLGVITRAVTAVGKYRAGRGPVWSRHLPRWPQTTCGGSTECLPKRRLTDSSCDPLPLGPRRGLGCLWRGLAPQGPCTH